ncbi:hypothetical protein BKA70DRAFT_1278249 [Coprinopsis sp. MPI-PUGE-AT-0042]|nr:hypothetical protein BKA70DRAFT_1278249 [Coprinopsis sp. MPI-PUGE-AT-0042]
MFAEFPSELLVEVFRWSLPQPIDADGRRHLHSLRSTCARWRTLVYSTPQLWSNLSVDMEEIELDLMVQQLTFEIVQRLSGHGRLADQSLSRKNHPTRSKIPSAIRAWFSRAAECPLTLHVTNKGGSMSPFLSKEGVKEVLKIMSEHRSWAELHIDVSGIDSGLMVSLGELLLRVAESPCSPWKELNRLSIGHTHPNLSALSWLAARELPIPLERCAPALGEVHLRMQGINFSLLQSHRQVTILQLTLLDTDIELVAINMVQHLPSLQRLSVDAIKPERAQLFAHVAAQAINLSTVVASSSIQDLTVHNDGVAILKNLSLPQLQSLSISSDSRMTLTMADAYDRAVNFVRRSECGGTLETIDIRKLEFISPREAVLEYLKQNLKPFPFVKYYI